MVPGKMTDDVGVVDARRAALDGFLDDASTFPAATDATDGGEDIAAALAAHEAHHASPHAWLTGCFHVPASKLLPLARAFTAETRIRMQVACDRSGAGNFGDAVRRDLAAVAQFAADPRADVVAAFVILVGRNPVDEVTTFLEAVAEHDLGAEAVAGIGVPLARRSAGSVLRAVKALAAARDNGGGRQVIATAVTAGGSDVTPNDTEMSGFLLACRDAGVPFTLAPGDHHPVRPLESVGGVMPHGFFNILAAAALAWLRGAGLAELEEVVGTPADRVHLGPSALVVGDAVIEAHELRRTRAEFLQRASATNIARVVSALARSGVIAEDGGPPG